MTMIREFVARGVTCAALHERHSYWKLFRATHVTHHHVKSVTPHSGGMTLHASLACPRSWADLVVVKVECHTPVR
jgi:hypothetical protein